MGCYNSPIGKHMKQTTRKNFAIVAGGRIDESAREEIARAQFRIGADRGALWLLDHNFVPDIAIGDFDSVTPRERRRIHDGSRIYIQYPTQKDATDLTLAVDEAIARRPEAVTLYGALGARFDHDLAAMGEVARLVSHNIYGEIVDNFNKITIVRRNQGKFSRSRKFRYLSVVALTARAIVTISGVAYPVIKRRFYRNSSLGISNEIRKESALVHVHSGMVAVISSADAAR